MLNNNYHKRHITSFMSKGIFGLLLFMIVSIDAIHAQKSDKFILFFGNSLTAGLGLEPEQAFPGIVQQKIDSLDYNYQIINAGLSGETSAGGLGRIDWVMKQPFDIFILELGANDGLRGLPLQSTRENLQGIIDKVKMNYPGVRIVIAGMMVPPNMGEDYTSEFVKIYPELARKNNALLIPFLLDGVAGIPDLNLADGIHPNVEGHRIVAETVWNTLIKVL